MSLADVGSGVATAAQGSSLRSDPPAAAGPTTTSSGPGRSAADESSASSAAAEDTATEAPEDVSGGSVGKASILDGLKIVAQNGEATARSDRLEAGQPTVIFDTADSPACTECGSIMVRNGSCYKCINCGATSGCS
jgi:ribonucleoside-diphosphate reductase alpha chain